MAYTPITPTDIELQAERWLPIAGADGYEVSDLGRVRSLDRVRVINCRRLGAVHRRYAGRVLRPGLKESGHLTVVVGGKSRRINIMVLEAFVGLAPPRHESLHWDGVPANNRLTNLRWGTRSENVCDSIRHGTYRSNAQRGEANKDALLSDATVREARNARRGGKTYQAIADDLGVSKTCVFDAISGKSWSHVV